MIWRILTLIGIRDLGWCPRDTAAKSLLARRAAIRLLGDIETAEEKLAVDVDL